MIEATELKNGTTFLYDGKPYKVIKYTHTKLGRGGATVRVTARNLISGSIEDKTFSSNVKVESVATTRRRLQYLYSDEDGSYFMDPKTFEQIKVSKKVIEEELSFIKEGQEVDVLFWSSGDEDKPLSIEIPPKVSLRVVETAPGVKGNSATNIYKPAVLENGMSVKVPLFVNMGDIVVIDTRTGEYVERGYK